MKAALSAVLALAAQVVLAHPGHGKPGLFHFHEFSDGLIVLAVVVAAGLILWVLKKK